MDNLKWYWVYVPYLDPPDRQQESALRAGYNKVCFKYDADVEIRKAKRALWMARAAAAKFWANYWFDVAPSEYIKYDRIGRIEGAEKEFILTKVTKHMTASDWVGLWEKVERLCRNKVKEYK